MSHSTIIIAIEAADRRLRVKRELEGGWFQWISLPLPAVLTIQSGINQLRYATLKGIMAAKKKEIRTVAAPGPVVSDHRIVSLYSPQKARQTRMLDGPPSHAAAELVRALKEDRTITDR
jgi:electron transfer flavoprotein beta subunit